MLCSTGGNPGVDPVDKLLGKTAGGQDIYGSSPASTGYLHDDTISSASGGHGSHQNVMPYQAVNYIICLDGAFPPHEN